MRAARFRTVALACALALALVRPAAGDPPDASPAAPVAAAAAAPRVARYRLPNGLDVVLQEDHRAPRVAVHVLYRVGQRDQPRGFRGIAHLVEHAMFERSGHARAPYLLALAALGASHYNGVTSPDTTRYFETVPAEQLAAALWMESERMAFLLAGLDDDALASAQRAVINEHRAQIAASRTREFFAFARRAAYPEGHPYRDVDDAPDEVSAISLDEARTFFQTWYPPANATLVLVGDFTEPDARALVARYFGPVRPSGQLATAPARATVAPVRLGREMRFNQSGPIGREALFVAWHTPAFFAPDDAALDLLADELTVRLRERLVDGAQLAVTIGASQNSSALGSLFVVQAVSTDDHTAAEILAALDATLMQLAYGAPAVPDLLARQRARAAGVLFASESLSGRAARLAGYAQLTAGSPDLIARDQQRYLDVTGAELVRVARTWLPLGRRVVATFTRPVIEYDPVGPLLRPAPPLRRAPEATARRLPRSARRTAR